MKKVMFALVAAGAAAVMATDGIESQNTVGYQQITIDKQYTILGCNFKNADNTVLAISNFIPYVEGMVAAKTETGADQIQIRKAEGGYKTYFLCNGYYGKGTGTLRPELVNQWVDADTLGVVATGSIPAGQGFWYVKADPSAEFSLTFNSPIE